MKEQMVVDPLGNEIWLKGNLCDIDEKIIDTGEILDDITEVIKRPTLLFKMKDGHIEHYYFRAIGWNKTILMGAKKIDGHYLAHNCLIDPTKEFLANLYLNGEQLI